MADITNISPVVTEEKLKDFYEDIKPFLGCPAYVTQEGSESWYSTDEKVIGQWIDGKPLYQKTLSGTTPLEAGTVTTVISYDFSNIDTITYTMGCVDSRLPIPMYRDSTVYMNAYVNSSKTGIEMMVSGPFRNLPFIITIQYTKTTDSAATTVQSDPNEYSTDEKIIGKWIDGKPIYQKTFSFRASNGWTTIDSSGDHSTWEISMLKSIFIATSDGSFFGGNNSYGILINMPSAICSNSNFRVYCPSFSKNNVDSYITVQYTKTTD